MPPLVPVPRELRLPHPVVAKLLNWDDEKRERQKGLSYISTWDAPLYDTPIQRRRLRLLSAIFMTLAREGCRADAWGGHPYNGPQDEFAISVGHQTVRLRASAVETKTVARGGRPASVSPARLRLALDPVEDKRPDGHSWEDGDTTLEQQARGIVLAIMLKGEQQHRDAAFSSHAWRVELKASTLERPEKERAEAERKERERQAALEQKRIEDLLGDAAAFRRARDFRAYVEKARAANADAPEPVTAEDMDSWARWALAQADRIDPVRTSAFRQGRDDQSEKYFGKGPENALKYPKNGLCHLMPNAVRVVPPYAKCSAILCQMGFSRIRDFRVVLCHQLPNSTLVFARAITTNRDERC